MNLNNNRPAPPGLSAADLARAGELDQLKREVTLLTRLMDEVPGVVFQYCLLPDGVSYFPYTSAGISAIFGVTPSEVSADAGVLDKIIHPDDRRPYHESFLQSAAQLEPWQQEFRILPPGQGLRWVQGNAKPQRLADGSTLWHGFMSEVTERKDIEIELQNLAATDYLTGLPNRRTFMSRIETELSRLRRDRRRPAAVIMIDLDHFKETNDHYGHASGDRVLRHFVKVLGLCLRNTDVAGRVGGEEFAVMLPASRYTEAMAFSERLLLQLQDSPYVEGDLSIVVSASIGITIMSASDTSVEDSLGRSDKALYRAKVSGRNRIEYI